MASFSEELAADTRVFRVKFNDKNVITYRVRWTGKLDGWIREDGEPSTLLHPWDDRRCFWGGTGLVMRQVLVVIAGQDYEKKDLVQVFMAAHVGEGGEFQVLSLRPENCNDCQARRESDFQNIRTAINDGLQGIINADLDTVKQALKSLENVVEVEGPV